MAAVFTQLLPPSEPVLGCLCTTQALESCVGKFTWGRASNLQEDCAGLTETERGNGTQSSTTTPTQVNETRTE